MEPPVVFTKPSIARMRRGRAGPALLALAGMLLACGLGPSVSGAPDGCLRLDFRSLDAWRFWDFTKGERASRYETVRLEDRTVLRASSNGSASAIMHRNTVDVHRCPVLRWRWKVQNVYEKGDATSKSGDDFPLRIFVCFFPQPEETGWAESFARGLSRMIAGREPPEHILNYVWSSRDLPPEPLTNPYLPRVKVFPVRSGRDALGRWLVEERNVVRDYRRVFGEKPPRKARIAVMNDSDDTGESSVAYIDFIACEAE
jgi:hypothetical protein